jgi:hypothetical protein
MRHPRRDAVVRVQPELASAFAESERVRRTGYVRDLVRQTKLGACSDDLLPLPKFGLQ